MSARRRAQGEDGAGAGSWRPTQAYLRASVVGVGAAAGRVAVPQRGPDRPRDAVPGCHGVVARHPAAPAACASSSDGAAGPPRGRGHAVARSSSTSYRGWTKRPCSSSARTTRSCARQAASVHRDPHLAATSAPSASASWPGRPDGVASRSGARWCRATSSWAAFRWGPVQIARAHADDAAVACRLRRSGADPASGRAGGSSTGRHDAAREASSRRSGRSRSVTGSGGSTGRSRCAPGRCMSPRPGPTRMPRSCCWWTPRPTSAPARASTASPAAST